jgi:hypothetical protein
MVVVQRHPYGFIQGKPLSGGAPGFRHHRRQKKEQKNDNDNSGPVIPFRIVSCFHLAS